MHITGAIFAGGKSSRFEDGNKALAELAGRPLIQHVIDRLSAQVSDIVFSGSAFPLTNMPLPGSPIWISDVQPGQRGPLVGLLSCMEYLQSTESEWLLTSACDTPLIPDDLGARLLEEATQANLGIAVASDGVRLQPANALWHRDLYPKLKSAVEDSGMRGFHQFLRTERYATATWPATSDYFINLNTRLDLADAEQLLAAE